MKNITRLKKLKEKERIMNKTAASVLTLDHVLLKSGDVMSLTVRPVNNKPWYQILHEQSWNSSSLYDGPDAKRAFKVYIEVLLSFESISQADKFSKSIPTILEKINNFYASEINTKTRFQEYHNMIQKSPKFLGINDF